MEGKKNQKGSAESVGENSTNSALKSQPSHKSTLGVSMHSHFTISRAPTTIGGLELGGVKEEDEEEADKKSAGYVDPAVGEGEGGVPVPPGGEVPPVLEEIEEDDEEDAEEEGEEEEIAR